MSSAAQVFEALAAASGALAYRTDEHGRVLEMGPPELAGGFETWVGHGWREQVHPQDLDRVTQAFDLARVSGRLSEISYRALRSAAYRWVSVRATPVVAGDGRLQWVGLLTDIHETVSAKEELRRSEAAYRALAEASSCHVWRAAPGAGYRAGSDGDRKSSGLGLVHPEDRAKTLESWGAISASGLPGDLRFRARTASGAYRLHQTRCVPIRDDQGEVVEWVGAVSDIHDAEAALEALRKAERLKAIGPLTAGLAHDFNNLLMVITSGSEAIVDGLEASHPLRARAALALHAAERGAELVDGLLSFSGQQQLRPCAVDLEAFLQRLEPLVRRALGEDVEVRVVRHGPAGACMADPTQLETALLNLSLNAREAMPRGGPLTIETELVAFSEEAAAHLGLRPGDYVMLSVSDEGCGMSPEMLEIAVEPFFTTKEAGGGSGLGLSMVHGFVDQSEGHLAISSTEGVGTRVRIHLPRAALEAAAAKPAAPRAAELALRVLLVEDDDLVREQLQRQLVQMGCEVTSVGAGPEALAVAQQGQPFELLMTDIIMPGGMNGFEVADRIQRLRPGLPVLFTSGYSDERIRSAGRRANARVLRKPYRRAALAQALAEAVAGAA
ncbi:hybrid sensor histidine kinase/response regulator [Phenylobacterium sp.]|jgi:signal transduction histidine kinase|uniref:hybrid sensor histidine kinase/response regulator n=1 Tax=Phenylobacterium sp. TaxID=1871053 RepID=UPI002F429BFA